MYVSKSFLYATNEVNGCHLCDTIIYDITGAPPLMGMSLYPNGFVKPRSQNNDYVGASTARVMP